MIDTAELRQVQQEIEDALGDWNKSLRATLYERGWSIGTASQERVPVHLGVLRASMDVSRPTAQDPVVRITYGGPATAYAPYQHEGQRADGSHVVQRYHTPGTGKHFLSDPLENELEQWPDLLVQRVRANFRS